MEPKKEIANQHGSRSDFIKNVSERMLTKVNQEANGIDEAKELFVAYMTEFCDEYDRCGYSAASRDSAQQSGMSGPNCMVSDN